MPGAIAVLGAGSWGSALAIHLANNQQQVYLWGRNVNAILTSRHHSKYLPGIIFPDNVVICQSLKEALTATDDLLICVPSHTFRSLLKLIKPLMSHKTRIVWGTKGLEPGTGYLLHQVIMDELGKAIPIAVISGPSFAIEVAKGMPTAVTIASNDETFADDLIATFHSLTFRPYKSDDIIGVQVGGIVKNIMAIAVGISDGLNFGANAKSALITRGLAEIIRLGKALGGKQKTFMGLSGMGDLILTCTENQSRNRRLGLALGVGKSIDAAQKEIGQVVEGIKNTKEVYALKQKLQISMPITEQVYKVIYEQESPKQAVQRLLSRNLKTE